MSTSAITTQAANLSPLGIATETIHYQLSPEELVQDTLRIGDGVLNDTGALVIRTGEFTGRSPKDKFIVKDKTTADAIHWNDFNLPIDQKYFDIIHKKILTYFENLPELWVRDCYARHFHTRIDCWLFTSPPKEGMAMPALWFYF